jgi:hydroxymethylpyrimidine/phosphomethylpyrimidine kinase
MLISKGMLASAETVKVVTTMLLQHKVSNIILDPV